MCKRILLIQTYIFDHMIQIQLAIFKYFFRLVLSIEYKTIYCL